MTATIPIEELREFDTCAIANAIEKLKVRLHNEGYTEPGLAAITLPDARVIGYATTSRVKSSNPPALGGAYYDRSDWWNSTERMPAPRIAVVEDVDERPGVSSVAGEVHASVLRALKCDGLITNGAIRDIPGLKAMNFPVFAGRIALSHGYTHVVEFGTPVEIFGLRIRQGDLLMADCHGAIAIPTEIAAELPKLATEIRRRERRIIDFCRSGAFSIAKLRDLIKENEQSA